MAKSSNSGGGKKGKKNRKHLRHKMRSPSAKAYAAEGRYDKNKKKRIAKHLKLHCNDKTVIGNVVDYRVVRLSPEKAAEIKRTQAWKRYLRSA